MREVIILQNSSLCQPGYHPNQRRNGAKNCKKSRTSCPNPPTSSPVRVKRDADRPFAKWGLPDSLPNAREHFADSLVHIPVPHADQPPIPVNPPHQPPRHTTLACAVTLALALVACSDRSPAPSAPKPTAKAPVETTPPPPPTPSTPPAGESLHFALAKALIAACPDADLGSVPARDAAAQTLASLNLLLNNSDDPVLWAPHANAPTLDPDDHHITLLHPLTWAKTYLSLFTFGPEYDIRTEGEYTVLKMAARFRTNLPPSEFPHPFWHSADEWNAYVNTRSVLFVFLEDRLFGGYFESTPGPAPTRTWDGQWAWASSDGTAQPRVSQFDYLFTLSNPNIKPASDAYTTLKLGLAANGCLKCHSPANASGTQILPVFTSPAEILSSRHAISAVLRENSMPPRDDATGRDAGLSSEVARQTLLEKSDAFHRIADAALLYESDRRGVPRPEPLPERNDPAEKRPTNPTYTPDTRDR